ncbi:hypothetical protein [Thalassospira alkalitolerans]|uniref:hypothetical protein n=1 Tax=Thalassospira alkalitolerans TaxID=1293890 RepID=UPI003AA8BB76
MDSIGELRTHRGSSVTVEDGDPVPIFYTIHKVVLDEHRRLIDVKPTLSGSDLAQADAFTSDVTAAIEDFKNEAPSMPRERLAMQEAARLARWRHRTAFARWQADLHPHRSQSGRRRLHAGRPHRFDDLRKTKHGANVIFKIAAIAGRHISDDRTCLCPRLPVGNRWDPVVSFSKCRPKVL